MQKTVYSVGSVTQSVKAVRLLRRLGLQARSIKLDTNRTVRGCTHGIEFFTRDAYRITQVLRENNVHFEMYHGA